MKTPLRNVLLIDDDPADNFLHRKIILSTGLVTEVSVRETGIAALDYLRQEAIESRAWPELIFLDINLPVITGWEFVDEFVNLAPPPTGLSEIVMLTTSENPGDLHLVRSLPQVRQLMEKPLTKLAFQNLVKSLTAGAA